MPADEPPSVGLVLDLVRAELASQRQHFEALDTKAGLTIGFSGLLVTTSIGLPAVPQILGAVIASSAATSALVAIFPRKFPTLRVRRVADYLAAPVQETSRIVVDTTVGMVEYAERVVARKVRFLSTAVALLLAAAVTVGIGVVIEVVQR